MKHLKRGRKFGRVRKVRRGFIRSLLNNLIKAEKITTTEARAKELRPLIAKKLGPNQIKKIFAEIAPRYIERKGGYTRIIKAGRRKKGDASPMAIIEFI